MKQQLTHLIRAYLLQKVTVIIVVGIGIGAYLFTKAYWSPVPVRVLPVDIGVRSASIAFITDRPVKSCVFMYTKKLFLKGKWICEKQKGTAHILTGKDLTPLTEYKVIINTGLRWTLRPEIITTNQVSQTAPNLPEPAYGSIITTDGKPVEGALVVVFPDQDIAKAVIAKTNVQGNYAVDISHFIGTASTITVDAQTGDGLWGNQVFPANIHAPFSDISIGPVAIIDDL